ncbi:hypothetical protein LOAG_10413 [Loa loa]|uniref:Transmembrane protein n=1 Tax=Loa loa TaxID=7209 RepID=A0A1I7VS93_LOALO|nr:hypothetical protein LOAG_10413 [Loa loa]EFO18083.2 hypothetical protein LOAG_10413 [Loa loa]
MLDDEERNSLLETVIFRPLYVRKCLGCPKASSAYDDVNDSVDMIATGRSDTKNTSSFSYIFQRLKEFYIDENVNFEKWITLKGVKVAFFSQTILDAVTRTILAKTNQRNTSFLDSNVSGELRKRLTKSISSGVIMAANIGCIIISITQFAVWREYFSLWTVPCATTVVPTIFSYSLGVKPLQAMKGGIMLGVLSSLAVLSISLFYDLSVDETYQCVKKNIEIRLKEERESELYRFMKEHHIRSKWFGKWMLNRSRIDENIDDGSS